MRTSDAIKKFELQIEIRAESLTGCAWDLGQMRSMFDYTYNCNVIGKLKIKTPIPYSEIRIIVIKPNDLYCKLARCAFIIILIIHWPQRCKLQILLKLQSR